MRARMVAGDRSQQPERIQKLSAVGKVFSRVDRQSFFGGGSRGGEIAGLDVKVAQVGGSGRKIFSIAYLPRQRTRTNKSVDGASVFEKTETGRSHSIQEVNFLDRFVQSERFTIALFKRLRGFGVFARCGEFIGAATKRQEILFAYSPRPTMMLVLERRNQHE